MAEQPISFLDRAANLREQHRLAVETIDKIRVAGGDWIPLKQLADDVLRGASDTVNGAWSVLERVERMARVELTRCTKEVE